MTYKTVKSFIQHTRTHALIEEVPLTEAVVGSRWKLYLILHRLFVSSPEIAQALAHITLILPVK